jgi:hypothetical protein
MMVCFKKVFGRWLQERAEPPKKGRRVFLFELVRVGKRLKLCSVKGCNSSLVDDCANLAAS